MLNSLVLGRYKENKTFIHNLNPVTKVISLLLFVLTIFINNKLLLSFFLLIFSLYLFYTLKVTLNEYLINIKNISYFLISLLIINLIFKVGLYNSLVMIIEIILLINYSSIFTLTTKPTDITYGLEYVLSPLKALNVPVSKVSYSISFALRFIPIIYEQTIKIMRSQASRGMDYYNSNIKGKIESLKTMIIPMFILSIKRADVLSDALEVRNFNFNSRTYYSNNKMKINDYLVILGHILLLAMTIGIEVFMWDI